jgi:N-methylhydantoinase A
LRQQGEALLVQDGMPEDLRGTRLFADMRYHGQAFELVVPWRNAEPDADSLAALVSDFHELHRQRFSYANPDDAVEIVTLRLTATGHLPRRDATRHPPAVSDPMLPKRRVFIGNAWTDMAIYRRTQLTETIQGPALIEEDYTTVYVAPGWNCGPGEHGDLLARKAAA